jgi:hypothetical protein
MNEIKKKWFQILTLLVILSLSIEVVWLSVQNRRMKLMLSSLTPAHQVEPLKAGERVGPVRLQLIGGGTTELKYDEPKNKHLLFIFSTTCPHCEKTMPAWESMSRRGKKAVPGRERISVLVLFFRKILLPFGGSEVTWRSFSGDRKSVV